MPDFDLDAALEMRPELPAVSISCGFSINAGDSYYLEQTLEERGYAKEVVAAYMEGRLQEDYFEIECNGLEILNRTFHCVDTGHSDEDLIGTCYVTVGTPAWAFLRDEVENRGEGFTTGSGTIHQLLAGGPDIVYRGVSEMGCDCLDLNIHFFGLDEVKKWIAIEDGDEPMPPEYLD